MTFSARHIRYDLRLFLITMTVVLACTAFSPAEPGNGPKKTQSIVAVIHCEYAPVSFLNKTTNTPSGFFVDIMDSVAGRAGLQVSYICRNGWDEMLAAVESGEADCSALLRSKEREKKLLFSAPIDTTYLSFFARSQSNVDTARVPSGHSVGVIKGSMSYEQLKDRDGVKLEIYGSYREGLFGLLAGEISLFAGEESMVLKQMRETGLEDRIKKVGKPFVERQRCLVVRKDNVQLLELMDKTLAKFVSGPEYQQIYLKWYGTPTSYWTNRRVLMISGIFLVIVVSGTAIWRYMSISRINTKLLHTISERKRAEERLRLHGTIIKNMAEGVNIIRIEDGIMVYVNTSFEKMFGYNPDEMIGKNVAMLNAPTDKTPEDTKKTIMDILSKTGEWHGEIENIRKDGTRFWCHANVLVFEPSDYGKVIVSVHTDITDQKKAQEQILRSLQEKEVLLKEIHHRVKNNLNVIASLLSLQSRYIKEPASVGIFEECRNRINSMALIHEKLYQTTNFSRIDFKEYLNSLIFMLSSSYIHMGDKVCVHTDIEDLSLDIDTAMTCGLMTNELVTNCLKHAFPENRDGTINISLFSENGKHILSVRDNGIGLPDRFDLMSTNTLGLQMVNMFTKQLEGTMHVAVNNGTEIRISF